MQLRSTGIAEIPIKADLNFIIINIMQVRSSAKFQARTCGMQVRLTEIQQYRL